MTATAIDRPDADLVPHPDPGFGATVAAEWQKLRTSRSPRRNAVLAVVLGVGLALLLAIVVSATFGEWSEAEQADFDPLVFPMSGSLLLIAFLVAIGVGVITSEYRSGMIRLTLTVTPRRGRVLAAKVVVVTAVSFVVGLVATLAMVGLSQPIYAANDLPTVSLADGDVVRMFALGSIVGATYPVLAVLIAALLRSTASSLTIVLALVFAPSMFGGLLPDWWQRNVLSLLPGPASDSVAISHVMDSEQFLHPMVGALVLAVWLGGLWALALTRLQRRDA